MAMIETDRAGENGRRAIDAPSAGFGGERVRRMGRPAVATAIALAIGVAVGQVWMVGPGRATAGGMGALLLALMAGILAAFVLRNRTGRKIVGVICELGILAALALGGAGAARLGRDYFSRSHVANFAATDARLAEMELTIDSEPIVIGQDPTGETMLPFEMAIGRVRRVRTWNGWQSATGLVRLDLREPIGRLAIGQRVRLIGWLSRLGPVMNPGQADRAEADRRERILANVYVTRADQVRILDQGRRSAIEWLRREARLLLEDGFDATQKSRVATLGMILLGDNQAEARPLRDDLTRNGVTHLIATSGLHVLILAGVLGILLRVLLVGPMATAMAMIALSAIYAAVVTPSPGAERAVVAAAVVAIAVIWGRRVDGLQVLALAVISLLVWQPNEIAGPGLQLGVVIVAGLILYARYRRPMDEGELMEERARLIARQIGHVRAEAWWRTGLRAIGRPMGVTARFAVLAWLIALPLVAWHFGALNPWSIAVGLALLPLAVLALVAGALKILLTAALPSLAWMWADATGWTSDWLIRAAHVTAQLNGAQIAVPQPSVWVVVIAIGLMLLPILAALLPGKIFAERVTPRFRRRMAWIGPVMGVLMIGLPVWAGRRPADDLTVTVLAVGSGQDVVVRSGTGLPAIIDAGESGNASVVRNVIGPFLWQWQVSRIGTLIMTDAVYGRLGATAEIAAAEKPDALWVGAGFERAASGDPIGQEMLAESAARGISSHVLEMGESKKIGGATVSVLWPRSGGGRKRGQNALVLRISYAGRSILIAGDATDAEIGQMMRNTDSLKSDVLIAANGGSWSKAMGTFVGAVEPTYIVASCAKNLTPRQFEFDVRVGQPVWRTGELGAITVEIRANGSLSIASWQKRSSSRSSAGANFAR